MFNGLFTTANFFIDILKDLTFLLDKLVYSLVQAAYDVFSFLADATILDPQTVQKFTLRVYVLLGIIMVFVLAFNLLNYIIDPDKINDKKVGASAFVKDVMIGLAIISLTPMLFTKLYSLQSKILNSGVLVNLVLGGQVSQDGDDIEDVIKNGGNSMVASIYTAFLYPADSDYTALDCAGDMGEHSGEKPKDFEEYCQSYKYAQKGAGINAFSRFIKNEKYNFTPLVTTIAGVVLLFFILSFCLNLAKRVGKMAIIQMIAPIPVTLELLPNKKGLRKTWFDTLIKVYLESFFFLLVMYIIVFLISLVPGVVITIFDGAVGNGLSLTKLVATVILIYGLLAFGKEAPKMVFDLLGIKETGVIGEAAKRALAIGGVTANTIGSTIGNAVRGAAQNKGAGRIGGFFLGGASAAARNLWAGRNAHSWQDATRNRQQINQGMIQRRSTRQAYNAAHGGFLGGAWGHAGDFVSDRRADLRTFVHGDTLSSGNTELSLLNRLSQVTEAAKLKKNDDAEYNTYKDQFNNFKTNDFYRDFEAWKSLDPSASPSSTEEDFINALKSPSGTLTTADRDKYAGLINSYDSMKTREDELKTKNANKLRVAAAQAKAILDANPSLENYTYTDSTGTHKSFDRAAIDACLDSSGNVTDEITLQKVIDDFNKRLASEKARVQSQIAAQQYADEQRQARRGNNGGGNSGGSSGGSGGGH